MTLDSISNEAVRRATALLRAAQTRWTGQQKAEAARLGRLMEDPAGRAFTLAMPDQVFRSHNPAHSARQFRSLVRRLGTPAYMPLADRWLLRLAATASHLAPKLVMRAIYRRMRRETGQVILSAEPAALEIYLRHQLDLGFRVNLNHLGEAVLGEQEAGKRLQVTLDHLADPAIDYISVKISAIFSQINLTAWDASLQAICQRLRTIYRAAAAGGKFVNLDMEEYRDLELTLQAFQTVLDEPEFHGLEAGIALQAYLPDSWAALQRLTHWARQRQQAGGAGIKVRLVKGANLAIEKVEAGLHGWNQAPYGSKLQADANFRRMLEYGCRPENAAVVRLGVGTHNLLDVALTLVLREQQGVADRVELEMIQGMAPHQAAAVKSAANTLLLYVPIVHESDFISAMSYLVRRLDENSAPENFLPHLFAMSPDSPAWHDQQQRFLAGWQARHTVFDGSYRGQPRAMPGDRFTNQADTDWTLAQPRASLQAAIERITFPPLLPLPTLDELFRTAQQAQHGWETAGPQIRRRLLRAAADEMQAQRFETLACMRVEGKKATLEADPEISEAIDFARHYALHTWPAGLDSRPLGVVVIAPPWNFPYAIPCGGVTAALAAGNAVILKPAPESVRTADLLVRQLHKAGIPPGVLQCFPCADGQVGQELISDPRTAAVVLTGAYETARMFQSWRPSLPLYAETSGKNSLIITAQADRELAIKDLARSAFGHAGQKCSAASLAILEAEVYDDPNFRKQLVDAVRSMPVGPAGDPTSLVTPLVQTPGEALIRALTTLDDGEAWLLEPHPTPSDRCLWSPGIKMGVRPGSWFHRSECFGPVLGLMRAESLQQAIAWQNDTPYGLTAGIHSLDPEEIERWREAVQAGNLYVNRQLTGAIVRRQPFGGWKRSSIGPGAKAGGPNYVDQFRRFSDAQPRGIESVEQDYRHAWQAHFSRAHDFTGLEFEANLFRYRPCRGVVLRLPASDAQSEARARLAAQLCGVPLEISRADQESDEQLAERLPRLAEQAEFFRSFAPQSDALLATVHASGLSWIDAPISGCGRLELRYWLREQSVSETRHRYGLVAAADQSRPAS